MHTHEPDTQNKSLTKPLYLHTDGGRQRGCGLTSCSQSGVIITDPGSVLNGSAGAKTEHAQSPVSNTD